MEICKFHGFPWNFQKFRRNFSKISKKSSKITEKNSKKCKKLKKISQNFDRKIEIRKRCKGVHCVDLGESFPTNIYLQNLASIQPRTSPTKTIPDTPIPTPPPPLKPALNWQHSANVCKLFKGSFSAVSGEANLCKSICVWRPFQSSTKFARFRTAPYSTCQQQHIWKINNFREESDF